MGQKLFIGGLAFSTSTERLREVFAAAGQVESAAVVTGRETGRSRRELVRTVSGLEQADTGLSGNGGCADRTLVQELQAPPAIFR
jgi:hypothetical protein